jgi:hypothetical protein
MNQIKHPTLGTKENLSGQLQYSARNLLVTAKPYLPLMLYISIKFSNIFYGNPVGKKYGSEGGFYGFDYGR